MEPKPLGCKATLVHLSLKGNKKDITTFGGTTSGCGSKLNRKGKPQVLVHVSICQGSILGTHFFEPQPS